MSCDFTFAKVTQSTYFRPVHCAFHVYFLNLFPLSIQTSLVCGQKWTISIELFVHTYCIWLCTHYVQNLRFLHLWSDDAVVNFGHGKLTNPVKVIFVCSTFNRPNLKSSRWIELHGTTRPRPVVKVGRPDGASSAKHPIGKLWFNWASPLGSHWIRLALWRAHAPRL